MPDNFFLDNLDLQFHFDKLDLAEIIEIKEKGYGYQKDYAAAPGSYTEAKENYRILLEVLGEICATMIAPRGGEADEQGVQFRDGEVYYPDATQDALKALRQAELMGVMLPWEYGGMNVPESIYQMMVELVSRAECGLMTIFGLQEIAASISEFCNDETKQRLLPRFARGELTGAMVLTEPDAGSDLGSVQMRATFDEASGIWRLNGVKRFITNGNADVQVILARSEEGSTDARGLSLFLIERDETVRIRRIENKLGLHSSPTCEIQYNNTPAYLVGKRRFGLLRYAMALMNGARLAVAAQALGISEAAYREAYRYASERIQFGQPIRKLPAVARMLLTMRSEIEASRALVCETGRWVDRLKCYEQRLAESDNPNPEWRQQARQAGSLAETLTPLAKYYASEMGNRVCYLALQVHGGVGYMREFNVERHYRDVRVTNIYEGTSQLQIVAALGKLLGHALDPLLEEWMALDYGPELADLKNRMVDITALFQQSIDALKPREREVIDYYANDLAHMAVVVLNCWLVLQDARLSERKRSLAHTYITEQLPHLHSLGTALLAADESPLNSGEALLTFPF